MLDQIFRPFPTALKEVPKMDDMIAVAVKDNDPLFRGYLPFIPASSSVRMSTLVVSV